MPTPAALADGSGALTVTVGERQPVLVQVGIDQMGAVVAGSSGNTITVTYTRSVRSAKVRRSQLPFPTVGQHLSRMRHAPEKMGTFTVMHYLKPADDAAADADGCEVVRAVQRQKAAGATASRPNR